MRAYEPFNFEIAKGRLVDYFAGALRDDPFHEHCFEFHSLVFPGSHEDQVRAWQQVREAGLLPASAVAFLIALNVESEGEMRAARVPRVVALTQRIERFQRAAGFGPDDDAVGHWIDHEAPPEYTRCWQEIERIERRCTASVYREYGEKELADLHEHRPDDYEAFREVGRRFFVPPLPPGAFGARSTEKDP